MKKDLRLSFIKVIGLVVSFGIQVVLTKLIGAKEYGVYVLFITWTSIISQILLLGYDRFIIKELSHLFIEKEKGKFRYTLEKLFFFVLINCLLFMIVALFIPQSFLQSTFFSNELLRSTWILIAIGSVLFTGFQLIGKVMLSVRQVEKSFIRTEVTYKFILLFLVLTLFYCFRSTFGINIILVGAITAFFISILLFLYLDRRKLSQYFEIKKETTIFGKENYIFFLLTFVYYLFSQIDKIYLGKMESMEVLGIYGLATTLCNIIGFSIIIYQRLIPNISYYVATNKLAELENEFKIVVKNALLIALPAIMFLLLNAEDVLLFFGERYVAAANVLRVLIIGQMVNYYTGPNGNLLVNGNHARIDLYNSIIVLLLTVVLNIIGYKYFGVIGVAMATSLGVAIINIVKVIEVRYFYKIFPHSFESILLTIIGFAAFGMVKLLSLNITNLILKIFVNFTLGTFTAFIAATIIYKLRGQTFIDVKQIGSLKLNKKIRAIFIKYNYFSYTKYK